MQSNLEKAVKNDSRIQMKLSIQQVNNSIINIQQINNCSTTGDHFADKYISK